MHAVCADAIAALLRLGIIACRASLPSLPPFCALPQPGRDFGHAGAAGAAVDAAAEHPPPGCHGHAGVLANAGVLCAYRRCTHHPGRQRPRSPPGQRHAALPRVQCGRQHLGAQRPSPPPAPRRYAHCPYGGAGSVSAACAAPLAPLAPRPPFVHRVAAHLSTSRPHLSAEQVLAISVAALTVPCPARPVAPLTSSLQAGGGVPFAFFPAFAGGHRLCFLFPCGLPTPARSALPCYR